jgi:hypothetical protein
MITKLPNGRKINDYSYFVSATNEVFIMEFCLNSLKLPADTLCLSCHGDVSLVATDKGAVYVYMSV